MPRCATHGDNVISCSSLCSMVADHPPTEGPEQPVDEEELVLCGDDLAADIAALAPRVGGEEQARAMLLAPGSPYHENPTQEAERELRELEQLQARADIIDAVEGHDVIEVKAE